MIKKILSVLLSITTVAVLMSGCSKTSSDNSSNNNATQSKGSKTESEVTEAPASAIEVSGELNIIHYLTETAKLSALDQLIEGFNAEYPNVTVNAEAMSMDQYADVLKLRLATGDSPDIIFGAVKEYSNLIEAGSILELTNQEFTSRISESVKGNVSIDGKVYGVPLDMMANAVFYNKDYFEKYQIEVPTTYDEFIEACETLKANGITPLTAGYQDLISLGATFFTMFYGAPYMQNPNYATEMMEGGKSASEYASLKTTLEQWRTLNSYENADNKTITTDRAEQLFASGETGMILIGTWGLGAIREYNPDGNIGGFMYPSENTAGDSYLPIATDDTFMIAKNSPNQAAAIAFFEYMTRLDAAAAWAGTVGQLSSIADVTVDGMDPAAQDIADIVATGQVARWTEIATFTGQYSSSFYNVLQEYALTTKMTPDEFCDQLDKEFAAAKK